MIWLFPHPAAPITRTLASLVFRRNTFLNFSIFLVTRPTQFRKSLVHFNSSLKRVKQAITKTGYCSSPSCHRNACSCILGLILSFFGSITFLLSNLGGGCIEPNWLNSYQHFLRQFECAVYGSIVVMGTQDCLNQHRNLHSRERDR